jgi:CRISPR type I-E-associated protein CasB/Cse2
MSPSDPRTSAKRLLAYLHRFENDRGAMADLRCALSPSPAKRSRAWPLLAPLGGVGNSRAETVAGLFAWHPQDTDVGNLGTTCRLLAAENNTFDARFRRLLGCDRDEICNRLRPAILAARPRRIAVNYEQLYVDLSYWGDAVKARWAREYWGAREAEAALPEEEPALTPE